MEGGAADGAGVHTCPECGKRVRSERGLFRTRRRWKRAALAGVVLLAAAGSWAYPILSHRGWMWVLPDRVVIEALPIGGTAGPFWPELKRRLQQAPWPDGSYERTMGESSRAALLRRAARGNWFARPIDEAWRQSYGLVLQQPWSVYHRLKGVKNPDETPAGEELTAAVEGLNSIPVELNVRTRDRWPVGIHPLFEFKVEQWWANGNMDAENVEWKAGGSTGSVKGGRAEFPLKITETGDVRVEMDVTVTREDIDLPGDQRKPIPVATEHRSVSYRTVPTIDDAMTPASGPEIDAALANGFVLRRDSGVGIMPGVEGMVLPAAGNGAAFGAAIELTHNGKEVFHAKVRWIGGRSIGVTFGDMNTPGSWQDLRAYLDAHEKEPGWMLHMRTDPDWSLAVLDADSYWKGDITFPVTILPARGPVITRTAPPQPAKK